MRAPRAYERSRQPARENPEPAGAISLVRKTTVVLRAVASFPRGVGLSELARTTELSKATCYRILCELEEERLVRMDREARKYFFGVGMFALAGAMIASDGVAAQVRSSLATLALDTQETTGVDVLIETKVLVAMQVQGPLLIGQAGRAAPRVLPATTTSTGKVLLAWSPDPELVHAAVRGNVKRADGSEVTGDQFENELDLVRARGYGTAVNELEIGASAVAAPVFVKDEVVAAVWVGGPSFRLTRARIPDIAASLKVVAKEVAGFLAVQDLRVLIDHSSH